MNTGTRGPDTGNERAALRVGGLTPLTTIDYPGQLAAVVYCQGCPWRCRYCHNGHLLEPDAPAAMSWESTLDFLERRRGLLDAVVFSGGEPSAQAALPDALHTVRELGFLTGLHTSGAYPARLRRVLPLLDWVGLDIKALPEDYPALTGVAGSGIRAWEGLALIQAAGLPFDVRVTVHDALLPAPRLASLLQRLRRAGVDDAVLQPCRTEQILDPTLGSNPAMTPPGHRSVA